MPWSRLQLWQRSACLNHELAKRVTGDVRMGLQVLPTYLLCPGYLEAGQPVLCFWKALPITACASQAG
jgi:hypothetical protein